MSFSSRSFRRFAFIALMGAGSLAGCDEAKTFATGPASETDDSNYQDGKRLAADGKNREAIEAFTKVILSRPDAPESQLEAGNLCLSIEPKEPLDALFHFRMFLRSSPNSIQAPLVRQRILACEKEFLKTLPFIPASGTSDDRAVFLNEQLKIARAENDDLKIRLGRALTVAAHAVPAPSSASALTSTDDAPVTPPPAAPVIPASPEPSKQVVAKRTYVIVKGDTLSSIAAKFYGDRRRWPDILNANKGVTIKSARDLRPGVSIIIP